MILDTSKIKFSERDIKKKLILPKEISLDLAEETGLHIGDGSMNFYSGRGLFQLRGHKEDDKKHYQRRIKELYKKLYNLELNIRKMGSTGVIGFQVWSDALVRFKHENLGLPVGKKRDLILPKFINNQELFYSFVKGLFDTDGCLYIENKNRKPYPRIEIKITTKNLILEIVKRLNRYGIHSTYYEYKRKEKNWNDLHYMVIRGYKYLNKWFKCIGSNNPKHIKKFCLVVERKNGPAEI